jgi:hypothetical protein
MKIGHGLTDFHGGGATQPSFFSNSSFTCAGLAASTSSMMAYKAPESGLNNTLQLCKPK